MSTAGAIAFRVAQLERELFHTERQSVRNASERNERECRVTQLRRDLAMAKEGRLVWQDS